MQQYLLVLVTRMLYFYYSSFKLLGYLILM